LNNNNNNATLRIWTQKGNSSALIGLFGRQDADRHDLQRPERPRSKMLTIRTTDF